MDSQTMINIAVALFGALGGAVVKAMWDGITELRATDKALVDRINNIEILVAGTYVKREEFNRSVDMLLVKLDAINVNISVRFDGIAAKLEAKMSREDCREIHGLVDRRIG
jgi:hypothetical protein